MSYPARWFTTLPTRVVIGVIFLVLLTVTAVGLPAILEANAELERQAVDRAKSGALVMSLLLEAKQAELAQAALLAANRPTLAALLNEPGKDPASIIEYLETLRQGMKIDGFLLCGEDRTIATVSDQAVSLYGAGAGQPGGACQVSGDVFLLNGPPDRTDAAWLVAQQAIEILPETAGEWRILAGKRLDTGLAGELAIQAGVELIVLLENRPITASLDGLMTELPADFPASRFVQMAGADNLTERFLVHLLDTNYPGLQIAAALNMSDFEEASRQLTWRIILGMAAVAIFGSIAGAWAAAGMTRPLENLRRSAEGLRRGDLFTPVRTKPTIREIQQVAFALEEARAALQHSLSQLQHEKEWNSHLLASITEGIITLDRTGRIVFWSPGSTRITGLYEEQVLGHPLENAVTIPGLAELLERTRKTGEGFAQPTRLAYRPPGSQNEERILSITTAPLHAAAAGIQGADRPGLEGIVVVLRDVTADERLHHLTGDFLANITHEFRTPLSALAAATELLMDQASEENASEDMHRMIENLRLSIMNLQNLIDNLLEGASIESGRFQVSPRPTDIREICQAAMSTMEPLAAKYGQRIVLEVASGTPERVRVDPVRTRQALVNLISNAARFGPDGGMLLLQILPAADPRFVQISVTDQGPGLPGGAADSGSLFQRFARLSQAQGRSEAGAGIGLSVVKAIVEAQGGQVGAFNAPAGGATFWFTVEIDENPAG